MRGRGDVAAILDAIRRRRVLALGLMTLCILAAVAYVATATPMFTSTAILVIDTKMTPPSPAQISSEPTVDPAVVDSQIEILKSDKIALDVVDRLGLDRNPEFIGSGPGPLARLLALLGTGASVSGPPDMRQVAVGSLTQKVKITRSGRSFLAEIKVTTQNPRNAAAIANGVAEAYIQDQLSSRMEASQRTTDWMQQRLKEVQEKADAADRALKAFRASRKTGEGDAGLTREAEALDAARRSAVAELNRARSALPAVASAVRALDDGVSPTTLALLDSLGDPETDRLAAPLRSQGFPGDGQKTDAAAKADAAGKAARDALRQHLRQLDEARRRTAGAAELRVNLLDRQAEDLAARIRTAPETLREEQLDRAAQAARSTYESLQNRVTRVSSFLQQQAMPVTEARIVTAASPPLSKSSPKTTLVLLLAAVGGAVAGIAGVFVREMFDRRIRWPDQITRDLGLSFLGPLPPAPAGRFSLRRWRRRLALPVPLLIAGKGTSPVALETLRSAKVVLDQAIGRERCRVVGIVSALEHEGKATVAMNLAALATEMRARVLVVDANLHDDRFARTLGAGGLGIATVVAEQRELEDCVVRTELGFDLLPGFVGTAPSHPAEILASPGMRRLFSAARGSYDYVIVTIPAVLCSVDARAIEDVADAFILTVASGRTTLDDVESAFATCPALVDRVVGVVLNRSKLAPRRRIRRMVRRTRVLELPA
ncbi:GNVR domain-containing protein [Methylobacterium crusticola]|uniref:GNVR domain-containing protein n=1 Tax=Methylobacterium crusticola TaxID=1697972 RepID=UPI001EE1B877|nr:GNVR domain-containing protein [Methylobacterium crusticola]